MKNKLFLTLLLITCSAVHAQQQPISEANTSKIEQQTKVKKKRLKEGDGCVMTFKDEENNYLNGNIISSRSRIKRLKEIVSKDASANIKNIFIISAKDSHREGSYLVCAGGIVIKYSREDWYYFRDGMRLN